MYHIPKSVYPGLFHAWDSLVCGPAPQVYFWFFATRVAIPGRCIIVWKLWLWLLVLGALAFKTRVRCPPAFVLFGKSEIGSTLALAAPLKTSP
jgi:hypothetical protein